MTEQRLANIEAQLARMTALLEALARKVDERIDATDAWRDRFDRMIHGYNGTPGMMVRIDRLEGALERSRWVLRLVVGAVVTLAAASAWSAL